MFDRQTLDCAWITRTKSCSRFLANLTEQKGFATASTAATAILGVDADGVGRGVRNWCAFLKPQGHWLLNQ
jgi:hypothetical protein